jgi:probable addiction module antidote protein
MRDRAHDEGMAEMFRKDPGFAIELLNSILEDGEQGELLIVLRQMAKAFGGMQSVAEKANLNATQMYRTLSEEGNPALSSLSAVLKAMGLRLAVERVRGRLSRVHPLVSKNQITGILPAATGK